LSVDKYDVYKTSFGVTKNMTFSLGYMKNHARGEGYFILKSVLLQSIFHPTVFSINHIDSLFGLPGWMDEIAVFAGIPIVIMLAYFLTKRTRKARETSNP